MNEAIVLVHSPLVGPQSWESVAQHLRQVGATALNPDGSAASGDRGPHWQRHACAVAQSLNSLPDDQPIVLVGHSGAGPLLPAIRIRIPHTVVAYIFVDAALPHGGDSHMEEIEASDAEFASSLRTHLETGGVFPEWTDEDLKPIIPDANLREGLLQQLRPQPLSFFEEPLPVITPEIDAPAAYIKLSPAYAAAAWQARLNGWPSREFDAGHFHMLVDPQAVSKALIELIGDLR